jgi:hypothetical protein
MACLFLWFQFSTSKIVLSFQLLVFISQGTVYFILAASALLNWVAFIVTKRHFSLYLAVAFTISLGTYLGFFRTQIKKKFNIRVSFLSITATVWDCYQLRIFFL